MRKREEFSSNSHKQTFRPRANIPADDDAVVEQVDLDVLDSDGLVEALRDQQPQQPPQVWGVVQRHSHLRGEALQQRQQHGPRVNLPCTEEAQHTVSAMSAPVCANRRQTDLVGDGNNLVSRACSPAVWRLLGRDCFPVSVVELPPCSPPSKKDSRTLLKDAFSI